MSSSRPKPAPPVAPPGWADRVWLIFLCVGAVGLIVFALTPSQGLQDIVYLIVVACGPLAILWGMRLHRPVLVAPWYWMAGGLSLLVIGDGIYAWFEDVTGTDPFPSIADAFYLLAYPCLAYGLHLLVRARESRLDRASLLDSLIVTAGLGLLVWVLVVEPTIASDQGSRLGAIIAIAYPVADVLLIAGAVRLVSSTAGYTVSVRLLVAALCALISADAAYAVVDLTGVGGEHWLDYAWLASYILWGAAALHPSVALLSRPGVSRQQSFSTYRLGAMAMAVLIAPVALTLENLGGLSADVVGVVVGSAAIFLLVMARMKVAIDQMAALNEQHILLQDELAFQVAHDTLTELPNRAEIMLRLRLALGQARVEDTNVAVLMLDLDGFKGVNDNHGHQAGDAVLAAVALRITAELRPGDIAARLGGDEFVVMLAGDTDLEGAEAVAERLVQSIARPYQLASGEEAIIGASIGISIGGRGNLEAESLLQEADAALYVAKGTGKGRVEVSIGPAAPADGEESLDAAAALSKAIEEDHLVVCYQPVVDLVTRKIQGFEALVRWEPPGGELIAPTEFIPVAEASDLIIDLDTWMLNAVCSQLAEWEHNESMRSLSVAVNISGRHVNEARVIDDVMDALRTHDVDPGRLILEVTETVPVEDGLPITNLHQLRRLGLKIALDDFGTGYSMVDSLRRLPLDVVKIDRSFLDANSPARAKQLHLLVRAARVHDLPIVAEGIERQQQVDLAVELGLEMAQGFFFGHPESPSEVEALVGTAPRRLRKIAHLR